MKTIALVYNPELPRAHNEWLRMKRWLTGHKIKVIGAGKVIDRMKTADCVVAFGGDGTVLDVSKQVARWGTPVLGVNAGHLGFLAATEAGAMFRTMARVLKGEGRVEVRSMVSVRGTTQGKKFGPYLALNEGVVRSGASGRALHLAAYVRNKPLASYIGDGFILSTPTGSTAYNLAASGPILYPELDVLLIAPVCPHSLAQRPLVMPPFETVEVHVLKPSHGTLLCIDGKVVETLHAGDHAVFSRAQQQVKLLMDPDRTYYQVLQSKLNWGGS